MQEILRKIYKRITPKFFRTFVWKRIHDIRFIASYPVNFPRQLYRNYIYKNSNPNTLLNIKSFNFIIDLKNIDDLIKNLLESNVQFQEGAFALYVSNEDDIEKLSPGISKFYPHRFAIKIIKSRILSPDGTPYYCGTNASETATTIVMNAVGSINEKKIISNILSESLMAPRVYDIVKFKSQESYIFAMIVEHIEGVTVTHEKGDAFLNVFNEQLDKEGIRILGGTRGGDFSPPYFGNNIITNSNSTYYVDVQNFELNDSSKQDDNLYKAINENTHFGGSNFLRPDKYSYQSVPELNIRGKRDSNYRIHLIQQLLDKNGICLKSYRVLDVGCNLGLFVMYALNQGAIWAVGLDMTNVAKTARKYMYKNGFSTFDIIGVDLKSNSLLEYLPCKEFEFVFYMSIEGHIGFPGWLESIDFQYFLYEGHEGENIEEITNKIRSSRLNIKILDEFQSQDGDSRSRPMLLCEKFI